MIKTILLADDSITMQKVIRLTFASGGFELITADNGDEAIKKAEDARPHIVLVDAALPGKNGYEVCEAIKNNTLLKDTPVIILAGTFNPLDDNKAMSVKADDSIVKPFESKHLIEKVDHLLKKFPPVEEQTEAPDSPRMDVWEENDVIEAPEFGAGIEETGSEQGATGDETMPEMKTPAGESEGEGGFDIEGFEINPFASEPLRGKAVFEKPGEGPVDWGVDEEDVVGFNDLESEEEIEAQEEVAEIEEEISEGESEGREWSPEDDDVIVAYDEGEPAEKEGEEAAETAEEPFEKTVGEDDICADETQAEQAPPVEDVIVAHDEGEPAEEEGEEAAEAIEEPLNEGEEISTGESAAEEARDNSTEDSIRNLVKKASMEVIEEVVRETVPGLIKQAIEDEMKRIKDTLKDL